MRYLQGRQNATRRRNSPSRRVKVLIQLVADHVLLAGTVDWFLPEQAWENLEIVQMSKKGITGHDEWVVTEALATALVALEQLSPKHQPRAHMDDIKKLLAAGCQPGTLTLHIAQAKCRLFPDIDPLTIYREYGLEDGQS
jgi:hypothetical protein